jgi:hypothetical protein
VRLTLRVKLCGRGPRAEADAARRSPPLTLMRVRTACRRDSSELTSRLGRRTSAGPHQLLRGVSRPDSEWPEARRVLRDIREGPD